MTPNFRYDPEANAAYLTLSKATIVESEEVSPGVVLDFDDQGRVVGVEFIGATERLPADALAA